MTTPITYVAGKRSLLFNDNGVSTVVPQSHLKYLDIVAALNAGDITRVRELLVPVKEALVQSSDGLLTLDKGVFYFDGKPLHVAMTTRIQDFMRDGLDVTPVFNFLRNLLDNPSKRAVDELWGFIAKGDMPITADGYFIAYKMVSGDYKDLYTGTMDNSVGATVKMRRNEVDEEKTNTCSQGLHFAAKHYVVNGSYGSRSHGNRLVAVKVNPRDVVAIPVDYNNAKGRACEYYILKELEWYKDGPDDLPVVGTQNGFKVLDEGTPEKDTTGIGGLDTADAMVASKVVANAGKKWSDEEVATIKKMVFPTDKGGDGLGLTHISALTGMSRRQIARIRDGQVGFNLPLGSASALINWGVPAKTDSDSEEE